MTNFKQDYDALVREQTLREWAFKIMLAELSAQSNEANIWPTGQAAALADRSIAFADALIKKLEETKR